MIQNSCSFKDRRFSIIHDCAFNKNLASPVSWNSYILWKKSKKRYCKNVPVVLKAACWQAMTHNQYYLNRSVSRLITVNFDREFRGRAKKKANSNYLFSRMCSPFQFKRATRQEQWARRLAHCWRSRKKVLLHFWNKGEAHGTWIARLIGQCTDLSLFLLLQVGWGIRRMGKPEEGWGRYCKRGYKVTCLFFSFLNRPVICSTERRGIRVTSLSVRGIRDCLQCVVTNREFSG